MQKEDYIKLGVGLVVLALLWLLVRYWIYPKYTSGFSDVYISPRIRMLYGDYLDNKTMPPREVIEDRCMPASGKDKDLINAPYESLSKDELGRQAELLGTFHKAMIGDKITLTNTLKRILAA